MEKAPVDIERVARETIELLKPLVRKKNVTVTVEKSIGDTVALVDAAQVQQVVTNLVVNATQAVSEGGQVRVRLERCRAHPLGDSERPEVECIKLVVRDDGPGISPENLPRLFEPFFTTKDVGEGTGLGLAVAYGIVRDHMGYIDVHSRPGAGATFTAFLPCGDIA